MAKKAAKKRSKKQQQSIFVDSADEDWSTSDEHENGNQDGLAEMSLSVLQDEPRCVADAAPTAAMAIPCETVAGASLCEAVAWQAKAGGCLGKHALDAQNGSVSPRATILREAYFARNACVCT